MKQCIDCGKEILDVSTRCYSCSMKYKYKTGILNSKGIYNPFYGKHHSQKTIEKIKKYGNNGKKNGMFGKIHSLQARKNMSISHGGTGIPYENTDYSYTYFKLRDNILERDNYICQNCGMTQEEHLTVYGRDLEVHHIDYNKNNNIENNLISLCKQCNIRANYNRDYWKNIFFKK